MTLLGIANDRANWSLSELPETSIVLLWRTDGPGHHVAVCNLNGWHVGLYTTLDLGGPDPDTEGIDGHPVPGPQLAVPIQVALAVDPADVAEVVESFQRTSESIAEP